MMAQQDIVGGLFGMTPESYYQNQNLLNLAGQQRAAPTAAGPGTLLNPSLAPLYAQAAQQGQLVGGGIKAIGSLLGIEDAELVKIRDVQSMKGQFDTTTADGLRQFAQALGQKGYTDLAIQAATEADRRTKAQLETQKLSMNIAQEEKLRAELQALGPNASEQELMTVLQKYGSPDKVIAALQSSQNKQAQLNQQRQLADERLGIQREALAIRQEAADEKRTDREDKKMAAADSAVAGADRVINEVKDAKKLVNGFTAGAGGLLASVPLTGAKDLAARLTTIKANLGFDRLQQMRDASPTGGALGQVAVQELVALQSTISSLDQNQSPKQLKESLDKIEASYARWRETVKKAGSSPRTNSNVIKLD